MKRRLQLVGEPVPDPAWRAEVARRLLGPVSTPVEDIVFRYVDGDLAAMDSLHADPRYIIGRLAQALTMMMREDLPPMNAAEQLLSQAIADAQAYRMRGCPRCPAESVCDRCKPDVDLAARYAWLWSELGLIDEKPQPRQQLRDVSR